MFNYAELQELKEFMDKLSNGIDPITNTSFPNDTILNNKKLSKCFSKSSEVITNLMTVLTSNSRKITNQKLPFYISEEDKEKIELSEEAIPISTFTYRINDALNVGNKRKLRATHITNWLLKNGYLDQIEHPDGKLFKVITKKSKSIGISSIPKVNSYGRSYDVNLYDKRAQQFILDNLNDMML